MNTKILILASAMLACSLGFAQAPQSSAGTGSQMPGAQTTPGQNSGMNTAQMNQMASSGQASPMDKMFVGKALQGGMAEVQLGRLTLEKSNNEQVKQFAQKMVDDHTRLAQQMKPVADQIGVWQRFGTKWAIWSHAAGVARLRV